MHINNLKFHHIGYAVKSILESLAPFSLLGYRHKDPPTNDPLQMVRILMLEHDTMPAVELVEPLSPESPVSNILGKVGPAPYHLCFESARLAESIECLRNSGFILVSGPTSAAAFENRSICFLYHRSFGLIEIVEPICK